MYTHYLLMSLIKTVGKMRMLAYSFSDDSTASFASERRRDWRSNGLQNEASKAPQLDNSGGLGLESAKAELRT